MTFKGLASRVAKQEGKKHQASIGDCREILKLLSEFQADHCEQSDDCHGPIDVLVEMAERILKKRRRQAKRQ